MSAKQVKFGVGGRLYPPAAAAVEYVRRVEAQGWDFVQFADQIQGTHPMGMLLRPLSDADPAVVNGTYGEEWFGSLEMLAVASVLTTGIEIHLGAIDPLRRSPAVFAQELLTLWHLSQGRTVVHIAQGESKQFEPYGESRSKPLARMQEALRVAHALWESGGEPISRDSEFWPLKDAVFPLELPNGTKPRLLVTGGGPTIERAAAGLTQGWSTFLPGGVSDDLEVLKNTIDRIKSNAVAEGVDPDGLSFYGMVMMTIGETDEEAWRQARLPGAAWMAITAASIASGEAWKKWGYENPLGAFSWPSDQKVTLVTKEQGMALAEQVPDDITDHSLVWGDPDRVAARCQQYINAGMTHLCFWNFGSMADPSTSDAFVPLMSRVLKKLRGHGLNVDARAGSASAGAGGTGAETRSAETVRGIYDAVAANTPARALAAFEPDVVLSEPASLPFGGTHRGLEAVGGVIEQASQYYDFASLNVDAIVADGDRVVAYVRLPYRVPGGETVEVQTRECFRLTNGKVVEMAVFLDDTAALAGSTAEPVR